MNQPSLMVRFAGSRLGAFVLLALCAWGVVAWYLGNASEWLMMAALMAGLWTLKCIVRMRVYRAWAAEWEAMGADGAPARAIVKKRQILRWCWLLALAVVLFLALPRLGAGQGNGALLNLWMADCGFLGAAAVVFVVRLLRRGRAKAVKAEGKAEAAPVVGWTMGRASSSPSRSEAASNVPSYCAALLKGIGS